MPKQLTIIKRGICLYSFYFLPLMANAKNYGLDDTAKAAGLQSNVSLATKAGKLVGSLLSLVGVIFFIIIIYAGISWMTAGGNEETVKKARRTIIYAVSGLVVILSAYIITAFLGGALGK